MTTAATNRLDTATDLDVELVAIMRQAFDLVVEAHLPKELDIYAFDQVLALLLKPLKEQV